MRSYCAIYVDVGYLLASAATRVTGTSLRRGVTVDSRALIEGLITQAETDSGLPLLRVNWYDSGARPSGMPDLHQEEIGLLPRVKLRLGRISHSGEQKGVDLRIGLDLATHGRNRIVDVIYLVSGDDDLTEAVEEAQGHGVQVVVLAVPDHADRPYAVARHLQREADGLILIDPDTITRTVRSVAIPAGLIPDSGVEEPGDAAGEGAQAPPGTAGASAEAGVVPQAGVAAISGAPAAVPGQPAGTRPSPLTPGLTPAEINGDKQQTAPSAADSPEAAEPATRGEPTTRGRKKPPTPSVLATKKPTGLVPPKPPPPSSTLTWSTSTGQPATIGAEGGITEELVDAVVRQVVTSWCASATPEALIDLKRGRPFIQGDLDRTLLLDLSSRSGVNDIDDPTRHALRDRFWELVDRVRLT